MTILQVIPGAYMSKLIDCNKHDMWTLIAAQLIILVVSRISWNSVYVFDLFSNFVMFTDLKNIVMIYQREVCRVFIE